MVLDKKIFDKSFWEKVKTAPEYAHILKTIKDDYDPHFFESVPFLSYSKRWKYHKNGSRGEYENPWYKRRAFLSSCALLALIYPEKEHYLTELQDIMWAICDEYSWAVPAHCSGRVEDDPYLIDLFASETGSALSEICEILEDRLDPPVIKRVRNEVRRRIITPYLNTDHGWCRSENNWASVCAFGVANCLIHIDPALLELSIPRLCSTANAFLNSFPSDGTCREGFGYWSYGFGFFTYLADLLLKYTNGKINYFSDPKIKNIATFPARVFLCGNTVTSFSDGGRNGSVDLGLAHYLHAIYPDDVDVLDDAHSCLHLGQIQFCARLRTLIHLDPNVERRGVRMADHFLPDAQYAIVNRKNYSCAAKGGDNDEPHNHNDLGSFIFADKDGQALCDLGSGLYTKDYFNSHRYETFCNNSFSHSVPIFDGCGQKDGREYSSEFSVDNGVVTYKLEKAYDLPKLTSFERKLEYDENGVTITDQFKTDCEITERFITLRQPEITSGKIELGRTTMYFDPTICTPTVSTEKHIKHGYRLDENNNVVTNFDLVYCIDLKLCDSVEKFTVKITAK